MRVVVHWHEDGKPKSEELDKFPSQIGEVAAALIMASPSVMITRQDWTDVREPRVPVQPRPTPDVQGRDVGYRTQTGTSNYGTLTPTTAPYAIVDGREVDVMGQPL